MEAEVKEAEKILFWRNPEAENQKKAAAEAAAKALNEVYKHFKFKNISEIPVNVQEWKTKRTLETNPKLAKLAEVHRLETLKYETPAWIQDSAQAFSSWHSVKNQHTQSLQYCALVNEQFVVDYPMLEQEFDSSLQYRRYLSNSEQIKRLNMALQYREWMTDLGIKENIYKRAKYTLCFLNWNQLIPDPNYQFSEINFNFVLTGQI
jgi:hypothetical protein